MHPLCLRERHLLDKGANCSPVCPLMPRIRSLLARGRIPTSRTSLRVNCGFSACVKYSTSGGRETWHHRTVPTWAYKSGLCWGRTPCRLFSLNLRTDSSSLAKRKISLLRVTNVPLSRQHPWLRLPINVTNSVTTHWSPQNPVGYSFVCFIY
jgi:hypothetical protein